MRNPGLQAIKDVGGVDNGGSPRFTLLPEEIQEIEAPQHVHVHGNLVQQQDLARQS